MLIGEVGGREGMRWLCVVFLGGGASCSWVQLGRWIQGCIIIKDGPAAICCNCSRLTASCLLLHVLLLLLLLRQARAACTPAAA